MRSRDGKVLLEHWRKNALDAPIIDPMMGMDICDRLAYYREGQNSMVRDVLLRARRNQERRRG